jgi:hypothetical protein
MEDAAQLDPSGKDHFWVNGRLGTFGVVRLDSKVRRKPGTRTGSVVQTVGAFHVLIMVRDTVHLDRQLLRLRICSMIIRQLTVRRTRTISKSIIQSIHQV